MSQILEPTPTLARAEEIGTVLRRSFLPLLSQDGVVLRPSQMTRRFGLDKSLAARLARAMRAESTLELVHWIPSPQGLRIVLQGAQKAGVAPEVLARAAEAVESFRDLIERTDGGRASLDAHVAKSELEVRRRREETSKQAVNRGMEFLLGFSCDVLITTVVLRRSDAGTHIDCLELHHRLGMRRLRPNTPLAFLSVNLSREESGTEGGPRLLTLDGQPCSDDPHAVLLREYSTDPLPTLEMVREDGHVVLVLPEDEEMLSERVTLTSGFRYQHAWDLRAAPAEITRSYLLHYPCRQLVRDIYLDASLFADTPPEITIEVPSPAGMPATRRTGRMARLASVDVEMPVQPLPALSHASVRGAPLYGDLLQRAFASAGWDPADFRGYRATKSYPTPLLLMSWWMKLANR